jgi:predicted ArsR family transcriptional regulator
MIEPLSSAKLRLLEVLKLRAPATAVELASTLELTDVAVRQHLQSLLARRLVRRSRRPPCGRGRPSTAWSLTERAMALFPDHHRELAVALLRAAREAFGDEGIQRLLAARSRDQVESYRSAIPGQGASLASRIQALAELRSAEGYMAESVQDGDGSFLLVEHHCPICEAAKGCLELCSNEIQVFRRSLGESVEVERIRHRLTEGQRCIYRIREAPAAS